MQTPSPRSRGPLPLVVAVLAVGAAVALLYGKGWLGGGHGGSRWPVANSEQAGRTIVVFGDAGVEPKQLGEALHTEVVDRTKSGVTTAQATQSVEQVSQDKPSYVLVSLGLADLDARTALEATVANLEHVFSRLQATGAMVAYQAPALPSDVGDNWPMAIEDVCRRKGVAWLPPGDARATAAALEAYVKF